MALNLDSGIAGRNLEAAFSSPAAFPPGMRSEETAPPSSGTGSWGPTTTTAAKAKTSSSVGPESSPASHPDAVGAENILGCCGGEWESGYACEETKNVGDMLKDGSGWLGEGVRPVEEEVQEISGCVEIFGLEGSSSQEASSKSFSETIVEREVMAGVVLDVPRECMSESTEITVWFDAGGSKCLEGEVMQENIKSQMDSVLVADTGFEDKEKASWSPEQNIVEKKEELSGRKAEALKDSVDNSRKEYELSFPAPEMQREAGTMVLGKRYSRNELEALRFVNVGEQKQKWSDILQGQMQREVGSMGLGKRYSRSELETLQFVNVGEQKWSDILQGQMQREVGTMGLGKRYSRSELEAFQFVNVGEQKQKWSDILQDLGPVVSREYYELSASNHQKKAHRNENWGQNLGKNKVAVVSHDALFVKNKEKALDLMEQFELFSVNSINGKKDWTAVEELCSEDDDSDDEYNSIRRPAFLVEGEPDFESGPPQDGLEYLRRVRWEAAQIPKVKVAKLDRSKCCGDQTPYMPNIPDIAKCPENLSPLKHWEDAFLSDFSELREAFSQFENSNDQSSITSIGEDICEESSGLKHQKNIPMVTTILEMDAISRATMLRKRINTFENASVLSRDNCLWMFSLGVAVDTPLDAEMSACFRCLLRKCSSLLAKKSELDDEVAMLSVLIVISGKYFGQAEGCCSY